MRRDHSVEEIPLDRVQRWMQAVVEHPGLTREAMASETAASEIAPDRLGEVVKPSATLSSEERVGIYHEMYLLRMEEALASDYPGLKYYLGCDGFLDLVRGYVRRYPSRSYTLNRLGDHLPEFLLEEPRRENAAFLHDLAKAELAISQAFDAEESPALGPGEVEAIPPDAWAGVRLAPVDSLRLLALGHPVVEHLEAYKHDRPSPMPRRKASWVVVYRRDYTVYRRELARGEFQLLARIVEGRPLGEAVAESAAGMKSAQGRQKIFKWFKSWISDGMFSEVKL